MRAVGVLEDSHFVQAAPVGPSPDERDHWKSPGADAGPDQLVRCHWVELRPDLELWGERGAFILRSSAGESSPTSPASARDAPSC